MTLPYFSFKSRSVNCSAIKCLFRPAMGVTWQENKTLDWLTLHSLNWI